jgi:hypothetical protein
MSPSAEKVLSEPPLAAEPLLHFERTPGRVEVELSDPSALFDRGASPTFPHRGSMLNSAVSKFLVDTVREDRRSADVNLTITFRGSSLPSGEEAVARTQIGRFFATEAEMVALQQRVNRTEGLSSLRYAIPVVVVAGLIAGLLTNPSALGAPDWLTEIAYLVAIVVTWVMLWDPIEKLLFDSYFIRLRIRALHKLAKAKVAFAYQPDSLPAAPGQRG